MADDMGPTNGRGAGPPAGAAPPEGEYDPGPPLSLSERLRLVGYFLRYLRPVRGLVVLVVLSTLLGAVTPLPLTFLPKELTEHFDDRTYVTLYFALVLGALVVGTVLGVLHTYW